MSVGPSERSGPHLRHADALGALLRIVNERGHRVGPCSWFVPRPLERGLGRRPRGSIEREGEVSVRVGLGPGQRLPRASVPLVRGARRVGRRANVHSGEEHVVVRACIAGGGPRVTGVARDVKVEISGRRTPIDLDEQPIERVVSVAVGIDAQSLPDALDDRLLVVLRRLRRHVRPPSRLPRSLGCQS